MYREVVYREVVYREVLLYFQGICGYFSESNSHEWYSNF